MLPYQIALSHITPTHVRIVKTSYLILYDVLYISEFLFIIDYLNCKLK